MRDLLIITLKTLGMIIVILIVLYGVTIFGEWVIGVFDTIRHALFF